MKRVATGVAAALFGLVVAAVPAQATVQDYWQKYAVYPTEAVCETEAPKHRPWDADGHECWPENGAWTLYYIYAT